MTAYDPSTAAPGPAPDYGDVERRHPVRRGFLIVARVLTFIVYAWVLVVEAVLIMGFFLLLFGANPSSDFVEWVYRSLDRAMEPFRGIFTPIQLGTTAGNQVESVFETSVLFAMIVYGFVALAVGAVVDWLGRRLERMDRADQQDERWRRYQASISAAGQTPPLPTQPPTPPSGAATDGV